MENSGLAHPQAVPLISAGQERCERVERRKLLFMLLNSFVMKPHKTNLISSWLATVCLKTKNHNT